MDKTININLGGSLFQIDEEAFRILRDYLQAINYRFKNVQGGLETIEDIESRIAEIFHSQKGIAGAITRDNVEAMIKIIGKPEDFDLNEPEKEQKTYASHNKRLYRNPDDAIISGVCGGLGAYLNTDPVLFRILFIIFGIFFGVGFLLYIVLWIALTPANTDAKKRELHGNAYHTHLRTGQADSNNPESSLNTTNYAESRISNAFNEVFRAIGRVGYIILRIILIIIGGALVITGFVAILSFVMIFMFNYPLFQNNGFDLYLSNITDFLPYVVTPSAAPWIIVLTSIAFILPMLAFIYLGIKMIIWFRARDTVLNLSALVLWVMAVTALTIILFSQGISFAESADISLPKILPVTHDTLYIMADKKVADLKFNKEFSVPDGEFSAFFVDSVNELYIRPELQLNISEDKSGKVEIRKHSSGRTQEGAVRKAESLMYNYRISKDTIYLDEYFTLPSGSKWTADFINIDLSLPENTVLYFDSSTESLFHERIRIRKGDDDTNSYYEYHNNPGRLRNKYWVISEDGLKEAQDSPVKK